MAEFDDLVKARFGTDGETSSPPAGEEVLKTILAHRTYRKYSDEPVDGALLELLLACALSAPAKSDLMQFSVIRVTDAGKKSRLAELSNTSWIATAPVVLLFCGDTGRNRSITRARGYDYAQNTLDSFFNAAVDTALAMQNFTIAAEAVGLGCCYVSQVRLHLEAVAELFALPEGVFPVCGLTAGWPGEERDMTYRIPPEVSVHLDVYSSEGLAESMGGYDARRNRQRPTPPEKQMYREHYGEAEKYGWSENTARRLSRPDGLSPLRAFLVRQGFDLA